MQYTHLPLGLVMVLLVKKDKFEADHPAQETPQLQIAAALVNMPPQEDDMDTQE